MNKKRLGIAISAAALAALLLLLLLRPTPSQGPSEPEPEAAREVPGTLRSAQREKPTALPAPEAASVIEEIVVEKREVCSGEDNFLTVRLSAKHAADPNLRLMMPGYEGTGHQMPFQLAEGENHAQPEMPEVVVFGPSGAIATMKIPEVKVKDCKPGPSLAIATSVLANTQATYAFTAVVRNPGAKPFAPVAWEWDFGDGADASTKVRTVEHGYEGRPQRTRFSSFLITARAIDAQGIELVGRFNLELRNNAFDVLRTKNVVLITPELNPRFPEMQADKTVVQHVRLHHAYDRAVKLEKVSVVRYQDNEQGVEEALRSDVEPQRIFGTDVIIPGKGIEATTVLDTRADPRTKMVSYEIEGVTEDGVKARGEFSMMLPSAPLADNEREIVRDPVLVAQIVAAQKILGRDEVTDDQIAKLRREGALDDAIRTAVETATASPEDADLLGEPVKDQARPTGPRPRHPKPTGNAAKAAAQPL